MSYEIIRSIIVKDGKVYIGSSSNNVYPKDYYKREVSGFTEILNTQGKEQLELEIFKCFESGEFQGGSVKKYAKALRILKQEPEYAKFDWRVSISRDEWRNGHELRKTPEFGDLLLKALHSDYPSDKFVITTEKYNGYTSKFQDYYLKVKKIRGEWVKELEKATVFYWLQEAEDMKESFQHSNDWKIQKIK